MSGGRGPTGSLSDTHWPGAKWRWRSRGMITNCRTLGLKSRTRRTAASWAGSAIMPHVEILNVETSKVSHRRRNGVVFEADSHGATGYNLRAGRIVP
jgi:hypothetical protein